MKNQTTKKQAIKYAKEKYKDTFGKRAYDATISIMPRNSGGQYVLLIAQGQSVEFYF